jgi:hypothetical protein
MIKRGTELHPHIIARGGIKHFFLYKMGQKAADQFELPSLDFRIMIQGLAIMEPSVDVTILELLWELGGLQHVEHNFQTIDSHVNMV